MILITIGLACAGFVAYRIVDPKFDARTPLTVVVFQLAALCFISLGAIAIGIERIRNREVQQLRSVTKPDEWLVEKFGPKGSSWAEGASAQNGDERSSPNRQMECDAQQAARDSLKR